MSSKLKHPFQKTKRPPWKPKLKLLIYSKQKGESCVFLLIESFRPEDDDDYEYEIFSILKSARARARVILAGKRGSRRHSTTRFSENAIVAGTSYQM